jgi:HD-like signal output (HDOD) protein
MSIDNLSLEINNLLEEDKLVLPTLPEVALKVRETVDDPEASYIDLIKIISQDVALSARLIKIANSPLMRGSVKVVDIGQAISRLGNHFVRNITTGLVMEQLFKANDPIIEEKLHSTWDESKTIGCMSGVLAKHYTSLPPEQATLAGLVHKIGVLPILTWLESHMESETDIQTIDSLIENKQADLGARILNIWEFPQELISVFESSQDNSDVIAYSDIILVAMQQHIINLNNNTEDKPNIDKRTTTAYEKLGLEPNIDLRSIETLKEDFEAASDIFRD